MTNPQVFYNNEDQWQRPVLESGINQGGVFMEPYYTVMRLPGEKDVEFIQMLPFTPEQARTWQPGWRPAATAPTTGSSSSSSSRSSSNVFGPSQIVARINQDQDISPQITLWNQQGSAGHPGHAARHPDERVAALRASALPEVIHRADPRVEACDRRLSEPDRHGRDADVRALARIFGSSVAAALAPDQLATSATSVSRRRTSAAVSVEPGGAPAADPPAARRSDGLMGIWPARPSNTSKPLRPRSRLATGPGTVRSSGCSRKCSP